MANLKYKIKIREKSTEKKTSLRYILFILFTLQVVFLTSLTGCGRKAPPVPPETSTSPVDMRMKIDDINYKIYIQEVRWK